MSKKAARLSEVDSTPRRGRPRGQGMQIVYETLRSEILMLSLLPGEHIDEPSIEARFNVSRTPIREALIRLQGDGLVRFSPNRGHYVSTIDFVSLPTAFESLDLLQSAVLKLATIRRTDEDLARLDKENEAYLSAASERAHTRMTEANHKFHLACGMASHNKFLANAYESVLNYSLRITRLVFAENGGAEDTDAYFERIYAEHSLMIKLIKERANEEIYALSRKHIQLFQSKIAEFVQSGESLSHNLCEYNFFSSDKEKK